MKKNKVFRGINTPPCQEVPPPVSPLTEEGLGVVVRQNTTAGDKIGVFAVKNGVIVTGINNLCLTATFSNGGITWTDASGHPPLNIPGATYYAYYPYQSVLTGDLVPNADNADLFFENVISNWTPDPDQSTYAKHTAQDLMVAKGTVKDKSLSFSMQHKMALIVIELPRTKYKLSTDNNYTWIADAPDTKFKDFTPYRMNDGTYHYLVKPNTNDSLSGSYTNNVTKEWSFSSFVSAGNYQVFQVDGGNNTTIDVTYTLAVGDFYMKDGSLLAGSTAELSAEQQAACIGVVYCVDKDFITTKSTAKTIKDYTHGLVVALKNAGNSNWEGASRTATRYKVAYPSMSSGWYLPNLEELQCICWGQGNGQGTAGKEALHKQFDKVSGSASFLSSRYWSSTEYSGSYAFHMNFTYGYASNFNKDNTYRIRCVLAF